MALLCPALHVPAMGSTAADACGQTLLCLPSCALLLMLALTLASIGLYPGVVPCAAMCASQGGPTARLVCPGHGSGCSF